MQIEEGKFYRTRDGRKVLIQSNPRDDADNWPWVTETEGFHAFGRYGKSCIGSSHWDLVAIWQDGPVVTETIIKTRIVPGVYDRITVNDEGKAGMVGIWLNNGHYFSADELDAAAAVLSALAKGLRDVD